MEKIKYLLNQYINKKYINSSFYQLIIKLSDSLVDNSPKTISDALIILNQFIQMVKDAKYYPIISSTQLLTVFKLYALIDHLHTTNECNDFICI